MEYVLISDKYRCKEYPIVKGIATGDLSVEVEELDAFRWQRKNEEEAYLYLKGMPHLYARKELTTLAPQNADIKIEGYSYCVTIEGGRITIEVLQEQAKLEAFYNMQVIAFDQKTSCMEWQEGDIFVLGATRFVIHADKISLWANTERYTSTLLELDPNEALLEGFPRYRRSPRLIKRVISKSIVIDSVPEKSEMKKGSLIQLIATPLVMLAITIGISIVMKRGLYVIVSAGTTVIGIITSVVKYINDTKEYKKKNQKIEEVYGNYLLDKRKELNRARQAETEALQYNNPTILKIEKMITEYSNRIYERSSHDEDFLQVSIGNRREKASYEIRINYNELTLEEDRFAEATKEIKEIFQDIDKKPVVIDLKKSHLGLVGEKKNIHEQIQLIVAQLTFLHSYHDVQFITIFDEKYNADFKWMNWYPHFRIQAINAFGSINSEKMRDQVLGSMNQIIKERKIKRDENKKEAKYLPHYIFIIDEPKLIMDHAIMEYLGKEGEELGFSIIYTTYLQANLPENIGTVVLLQNTDEATFLLNNKQVIDKKIQLQHIGNVALEKMARDLSVLVHEQGIISQIPESITFFEMYGIERPEQLKVEERWKKNESHKSLAVPLGVRSVEDYVYLNLHEKAHGPHGLVAGTTGSGKSEIIQSYILSLAVCFHPYEVGFLLIDYKGGGMAGLFKNLPHLLGTITNLDGNESLRAMASIKSELARRQRIFSQNQVNHINAYNKLFKLGKVTEPIPHLFLISDEFAELKKEQPEFMDELISTARIGRSLGVHLILATQKPSGVVNDQIWTNSKFKLALKVQNEADSKEIIKTPDAAFITQAGRAYLQVGNNEIYELFQSAWSGASYSEDHTEVSDDRVYLINELGQGELVNQDLSGLGETDKIKKTQLDVVVDYVNEVFQAEQMPQVQRPWLPSLGTRLVSPATLQDIQEKQTSREEQEQPLNLKITLGMLDIPEEQRQLPYERNLGKDGNLVYFASSGYGKSTLLSTIIVSLALQNSVDNLNFYLLDYGNNALIPMNGLPHTADYITFDDDERLGKFVHLIQEEIKLRKRKMAEKMVQNFDVYNQSSTEKMKAIVVVVDNFDVVKEKGFELEEFFTKLSRDGVGLGIYLVITATRMNGIRYATLNNFKNKIAGYLFDTSEATSIVGKSTYALPEIKGRALVKMNQVNLMQIYTMVEFDSEVMYSNRIKELVQRIQEMYPTKRAPRIPILPEVFTSSMLSNYRNEREDLLPLGLDLQTVEIKGIETGDSPFVIVGDTGKGKTNILRVVMSQIVGKGRIHLFDNSEMGLFAFKDIDDVQYVTPDTFEEFAEELNGECHNRKGEFLCALEENSKSNPKTFYKNMPPYYIVIDDVELFIEQSKNYVKEYPNFMKEATEVGIMIIMTAHTGKVKGYDDLTKWVKSTVNGLVLSNQGTLNIFPVASTRDYPQPGNALLFKNGSYSKIKLPRYEERGEEA